MDTGFYGGYEDALKLGNGDYIYIYIYNHHHINVTLNTTELYT